MNIFDKGSVVCCLFLIYQCEAENNSSGNNLTKRELEERYQLIHAPLHDLIAAVGVDLPKDENYKPVYNNRHYSTAMKPIRKIGNQGAKVVEKVKETGKGSDIYDGYKRFETYFILLICVGTVGILVYAIRCCVFYLHLRKVRRMGTGSNHLEMRNMGDSSAPSRHRQMFIFDF